MQSYPRNLSEADRRVARKWRLASVAFYGSFLAGFIMYVAINQGSAPTTLASNHGVAMAAPAILWPGERFR
jgi:hypothetical protein